MNVLTGDLFVCHVAGAPKYNLLCSSSNTSRRTSSDFQTPRRVEIARQSQAFLTSFEGVLKSEEVLLKSI